jgi:hypothetical protein
VLPRQEAATSVLNRNLDTPRPASLLLSTLALPSFSDSVCSHTPFRLFVHPSSGRRLPAKPFLEGLASCGPLSCQGDSINQRNHPSPSCIAVRPPAAASHLQSWPHHAAASTLHPTGHSAPVHPLPCAFGRTSCQHSRICASPRGDGTQARLRWRICR